MSHVNQTSSRKKQPSKARGNISVTIKILSSNRPNKTQDAGSETSCEPDSKQLKDLYTRRFKKIYTTTEFSGDEVDSVLNTRSIKLKVTASQSDYGKPSCLFEQIRRNWCSTISTCGSPHWLESCETHNKTFGMYKDTSFQSLQPAKFSLGNFQDRGVYIKHWSSEENPWILDGVSAEFASDTQTLVLSFDDSRAFEGQRGFRLEFEYRQFERYIVADENQAKQEMNIYVALQWPPRVFQEKTTKDILAKHESTNWNRRTSFLGCSREILGQSSVVCFTFSLEQDAEAGNSPLNLISKLARLGFSVYFAAVKTCPPRGLSEVPRKPSFRDFRVGYALECLLSRGFKVRDRVSREFYDILRKTGVTNDTYRLLRSAEYLHQSAAKPTKERVCKALYRLVSYVEDDRFCALEFLLNEMLFGSRQNMSNVEFEKPKHYVYVPRIIVTPTQEFLVPPELVAENRVIRSYGHEYTLRIAFRDEDFSKMQSSSPNGLESVLDERVVQLLSAGVELCGRHFEFLACSNSQLRDHGAWLFAPDGTHTAADIRESLGELDQIRCVATYVSRMGQCFSSTKESVKVTIGERSSVYYIDDITRDFRDVFFSCCKKSQSGTYTFSDGIGKLSKALSKKVSQSLGMKNEPSAYQIRYGGCKGMLAVDPTLPEGDSQEIIHLRKSMKKFESNHASLEICEGSRPNLLYLNRQCITLLSGLGVPDEVFIGLQDKMLHRLASMLLFETVAIDSLRQNSIAGGLKVMALSKSGINVTCEPFFRSLLLAIYKSKLGDLLRRARITIPESHGRLMMGVLDETKTLEYGQVFIRYSKRVSEPGKDLDTLTGHVMVSKNPCFHPGDMRGFEAVDIDALHHLIDVIVFPAKGPRPHTDEMSGSDLDGDKYFVTWYGDLDPNRNNEDPMDFTAPKKKVLDRPVQVSDMIQFVADYIKNDQLGIIANAHTVHADSQEEGIFSEACIKLAHMHSDAVDFPKTGECPLLPKELRPTEYPDFMMKGGKPRYKSKRVLGILFRKCKSLQRYQRFNAEDNETIRKRVQLDEDLIVPGYEEFLDDAIDVRDRYNSKLGALMALYGLRDEGEVISGCLIRVSTRMTGKTDERFEVAQMVQASLSSLRNSTRHEFYEEFGGENEVLGEFETRGEYPLEILQKASAWYKATYGNLQSKEEEDGGSDLVLVSFPWVADRILAHIKQAATESRERLGTNKQHALRGVSDLISEQLAYYFKGQQRNIVEDWELRCSERDKMKYKMKTRSCLCGSSLTGICVGSKFPQPTQLYVHYQMNANKQVQCENMRSLARVLLSTQRCQVELKTKPCVHIIFKKDSETQYFITSDSTQLLHSGYIALHIQRCPSLLQILLVIMHWGRKQRLAGSFKDCFLTPESLALLFLSFSEAEGFITKIESQDLSVYCTQLLNEPQSFDKEWRGQVLEPQDVCSGHKGFSQDVDSGYVLVKFFETYSNLSQENPRHITSVLDPVLTGQRLLWSLGEEDIQRFSDAALHAYHEIAQCNGLDSMLVSAEGEQMKEMQETIPLPQSLEGFLRFAEEFVSVEMSKSLGAQIFIRRSKRSSGYTLEAVGNYLTIHKVNNEVENLESKLQLPVYDHVVSGANHVIFLDQSSPTDMVEFKRLKKGDYAINITGLPAVRRDEEDKKKFFTAFNKQLILFKSQHVAYVHGSNLLQIFVTFGSIYMINTNSFQMGPGSLLFVTPTAPTTVNRVEIELSETADAKFQTQRNRNNSTRSSHKFIPHKSINLASSQLQLKEIDTNEKYDVIVRLGRNNSITFSYDANKNFTQVQIPPIKWLVVDAKSLRPATSRSRDIDFQLVVASMRHLPQGSVTSSGEYEKFMTNQVFDNLPGNALQVRPEFQRKVYSIRHEVTRIYSLEGFSERIRLLQTTFTKFEVGKSPSGRVTASAQQQGFELQHSGFDGLSLTDIDPITEQMWSAAKLVRSSLA